MSIQIKKVATFDRGRIYASSERDDALHLGGVLTNLKLPESDFVVRFSCTVGDVAACQIDIDVPFKREWINSDNVFWLADETSPRSTHIVCRGHIFLVRGLFAPERDFDIIRLQVKRHLLEENLRVAELKRTVANLERAEGALITSAERLPIPSDVKIAVWARDEGRCVMCGHMEHLQFDHVIPVAKGGGNSFENVQILCRSCNLEKSDRIE